MTTSLTSILFIALASTATVGVLARAGAADNTKPAPPPPGPVDAKRPPPPPPEPTCPSGGAQLFGVLHQYSSTAPDAATHPTDSFNVNEAGAWRLEQTIGGKNSEQAHGCLSATQLTDIRQTVRKASWKTTASHIRCMARSNEYTDYTVNGKIVYTAKLCQSAPLDADSQQAVNAMNALQTQVTAKK